MKTNKKFYIVNFWWIIRMFYDKYWLLKPVKTIKEENYFIKKNKIYNLFLLKLSSKIKYKYSKGKQMLLINQIHV